MAIPTPLRVSLQVLLNNKSSASLLHRVRLEPCTASLAPRCADDRTTLEQSR